jgi:hypothetical protein
MKIFLDIGHCWPDRDRGAADVLAEEDVIKAVGKELVILLQNRNHEVRQTVVGEPCTLQQSLDRRVEQSNNYSPDLFISLHCNANEHTANSMGVEAYALSRNAIAIAQRLVKSISSLGFKERVVRIGDEADWLYVLTHTEDPAILLELFFIDSIADCNLFKEVGPVALALAIANAIAPASSMTPPVNKVSTPTPEKTELPRVKNFINSCDTGLVRGLSLQIINKMNRMVPAHVALLEEVDHPLIKASALSLNPYLQPKAAAALDRAIEKRGQELILNSCFRTLAQQWLIKTQCNNGLCGIPLAAPPDKSNHGNGSAIDIEDHVGWKPYLEAEGWRWLGNNDKVHFDYWGLRTDLNHLQVSAFQMLHNKNNSNQIATDGSYGPITAECLANAPANGW